MLFAFRLNFYSMELCNGLYYWQSQAIAHIIRRSESLKTIKDKRQLIGSDSNPCICNFQ